MQTLGLRHVALLVKDPQVSKDFYTKIMRMQIAWEPDPDNVYLTSDGQDNLALHRAEANLPSGQLDHIGFILKSAQDVDAWYAWVKSHQVEIVKEIKTHRDRARSFYMKDPDGIVIQMLYHPPIAS